MPKIALVHEMLVKMGGAERVLTVLAKMFPESPIYTLFYAEKKCGAVFPRKRVQTSFLQKYIDWGIPYQFLIRKMPLAIESFDFSDYDLVISSSSAFAHGIITNMGTKHLCYCHSPMRYAWDYTHQYRQEKGGRVFHFCFNWLIHKIRIWDKIAADRPDQYLANSQNVQKRLKKYYQQEAKIIYPPVDLARFRVTPQHQNYFLIVSALSAFKKVDLAIQAFNQTTEQLMIIGDGQERAKLEKMANKNIRFLGKLNDREVTPYLQNCQAFIFPGEEDFGIAPVEAMACGKPVLGYGKGGLLETMIAGETGEFFTEPTPKALLAGLRKLQQNYAHYDPLKIRAQAENFSQDNFEREIQKIVKEIFYSSP